MKKNLVYIMPITAIILLASIFAFGGNSDKAMNQPPKVGEIAPEILLSSPDGKEIALSSLRGKIVLVDFWASWCGPCRKENPNLARAYEKFRNASFPNANGFTIYSISLDNDQSKWAKAIKADKIDWPYHVSDLLQWNSPVAAQWGIDAIPMNFLLDANGKILAVNLKGKQLEDALKTLQ